MADHAIDISTSSDEDDDEIEVVVVDCPTVRRSQPLTIDLTNTGADVQNSVACTGSNISRRADAKARNTVTIIDLYSNNDNNRNESTSKQSPAKNMLPFRSSQYADVVIVESPTQLNKIVNASPKQTPSRNNSVTPQKRSHAKIASKPAAADAAVALVDLTDLENDECTVYATPLRKRPGTVEKLKANIKSSTVIQPDLTLTIENDSSIASVPERNTGFEWLFARKGATTQISDSTSPRMKASVTSPVYKNNRSRTSKEMDISPSSDNTAEPVPSEKSATTPSELDEDYNTTDSQSSTSLSIDSVRVRKRARKESTPMQRTLRPRAAGKAVVRRNSVRVNNSALIVTSSSSVTDNTELSDKIERISQTALKELPIRESKNRDMPKLEQRRKSSRKPPKTVIATRESSRPSPTLKNTNVTNVPLQGKDQLSDQIDVSERSDIDDSERSDDSTHEGDSAASSLPMFNTDISSHVGNTIIINWGSLTSRSNYQHYDTIDNMIAKTKYQEHEEGPVRTIPVVPAGESRFFAPRYCGRQKDLIQWATFKQSQKRQVQLDYISIYKTM